MLRRFWRRSDATCRYLQLTPDGASDDDDDDDDEEKAVRREPCTQPRIVGSDYCAKHTCHAENCVAATHEDWSMKHCIVLSRHCREHTHALGYAPLAPNDKSDTDDDKDDDKD